MKKTFAAIFVCLVLAVTATPAQEKTFRITKKYLNIPVSQKEERSRMTFSLNGREDRSFVIRLASGQPDYWVFADVSAYKGKNIRILVQGNPSGLANIIQEDTIRTGGVPVYHEKNRPQYHFTTRRGWTNDPNGLLFYSGEYHLFYQHNPYEREWENMHWGHAVSNDLVHWQELPEALYPDKLGTMFSGSAVIDYQNTSGFGKGNVPPMIAVYTTAGPDRQAQCIAYSLDKGRTWAKYDKNPVIDSKEKWNSTDTRDPRVFWYKPGNHWVLVLNERDGNSIYTSTNLKDWKYESHVTGFWECPDLFELPVDGNPENMMWVMSGASSNYMLGTFDGKAFTPLAGKYYYCKGSMYAAQTFNNIPESDGRRIQIGWGRIQQPGMPFNSMMLLPTELTLRTTKEGVRLFSFPVKETEQLFSRVAQWKGLSSAQANEHLKNFGNRDLLRIRTTFRLVQATSAGVDLNGQRFLDYDLSNNTINGVFYSPQERTSMELTADIYLDKTSIEVFIDGGIYSYSMERKVDSGSCEGFRFWGNNIEVVNLEVDEGKSIW